MTIILKPEGLERMVSPQTRPTLSVTIPLCPPSELLPNHVRRLYYKRRWEITKGVREMAHYAALASLPDDFSAFTGPVVLDVVIAWAKGRQRCDFEAAVGSMKAIVDGLQDAGVFRDDKQVVGMTIVQERDPAGIGSTVVAIREETG